MALDISKIMRRVREEAEATAVGVVATNSGHIEPITLAEPVLTTTNASMPTSTTPVIIQEPVSVPKTPEEKKTEVVPFVNLHHHDGFSIRSAIGTVAETLSVIKGWGCSHYAVTNYNEISGWVVQHFGAVKEGITPILGMEICLNNFKPDSADLGSKETKILCRATGTETSRLLKDLTPDERSAVNYNFHLLVLAADITGYTNIIRLHNEAQLNWFYMRPRIYDHYLHENGKGVVTISPYQNGDVWIMLESDNEEAALERCRFYQQSFDQFYLEVVLIDNEKYAKNAERIVRFAKKHSIPMVVTLNSHYITPEEEDTFAMLLEMGTRDGVLDVTYQESGMHLRTSEQVDELYQRVYKSEVFTEEVYQECLANVAKVCDRIKVLKLDTTPKLPKFENSNQVLTEKAQQGLARRGKAGDPVYQKRLEYELMNVIKAGFADYFLLLEDMVSWCRKNGVLCGPGRGSASGSLILYSLNVTQIDPVKYNLLFERFLDASRLEDIISKGGEVTGCFTEDTLVLTPNGPKEISSFQENDGVVDANGETRKVNKVWEYGVSRVVRVVYGGWFFDCTDGHTVLIQRNGNEEYMPVSRVLVGDFLVEKTQCRYHEILAITQEIIVNRVFDLEVEGSHCYRVCGKPVNKVEMKNGDDMWLSDKEVAELI